MSARPQVGAWAVVRTKGLIGWCIRKVTRSEYNHAFVYVGYGKIVEAQPQGAILSDLSVYDGYPQVWSTVFDPADGNRVALAALGLLGTRYGFLDIVSIGLLQYGIKPRLLRWRVERQDRLICSQLVDTAEHLTGVELFSDARWAGDVTPGDLGRLLGA